MKYHYVYIITNKVNNKFYIGKHSTNNLDDGYMGSGIAILNAIEKYGIENFSKRILCFCDSSLDAYKVEEFLVTENLIKHNDCYNMMTGGGLHRILSEESKEKMRKPKSDEHKKKLSEANKGKQLSEETKKKISLNHAHWNKGKKGCFSEDVIKRISKSHKGKIPWNKGKHVSELSKEKNRQAHLSKTHIVPKFKWLTPTGEIKEMCKTAVTRFHPDWQLLEN